MVDSFTPDPWYQEARDGPLETYLEKHDGFSCQPLFHGYAHFELLKEKGLFIPRYSAIRLMWNVVRGDEFFDITEDYMLEGLTHVPYHTAREGIFHPQVLLEECPEWASTPPPWEALDLNRGDLREIIAESLNNSPE